MIPLPRTHPQFGSGLMVSAKITFEMPSTRNSTISRSVSVRGFPWIAQEQQADDQEQGDRDELKPEVARGARR